MPFAWATSSTTPYYPHPEKSLREVFISNSAFIFSEAFGRIALVHDSLDEFQQHDLRLKLVRAPFFERAFQFGPALDDETEFNLEAQRKSWLLSYPTTVWQPQWGRLEDPAVQAHRAVRLAYEVTGIRPFKNVDQILYTTIYGPDRHYRDEAVKRFETAASDFCSGRISPEVRDVAKLLPMPQAAEMLAWIHSELPKLVAHKIDGAFLGEGKTCESLVRDLFRIVEPHQSPLGTSKRTKGQIEGGMILVAREFFPPDRPAGESTLFKILDALSRVQRLDPFEDDWTALRIALRGEVSDHDLMLAFASISHNHAVELYLEKLIIELVDDDQQAQALAWRVLDQQNHLYDLLNQHHADRRRLGFSDLKTSADRPYHFWGGALVSCELARLGYRPAIAKEVSGVVGSLYEYMTRKSAKDSIDEVRTSVDSKLHVEGAWFGAKVCALANSNNRGN